MGYIFRKFIFLFVLLVLGYAYYYKNAILYIPLNNHNKIQVPKHIVWSRNCNQYMEWLHNQAIPISSNTLCPWSKLTQNSIVEFAFNDLNLYIPGEYIWQNNFDTPGNDSIHLIFKYPDMIATTNKDGNSNINVILYTSSLTTTCIDNQCDASQAEYKNITNIAYNDTQEIPNTVEKLYKLPESKLIAYKINNQEEFLIRGNPLNPDYWLHCDGVKYNKNPSHKCKTYVNYNNKINIYYDFDYINLLQYHDDIRNKISEKIHQFQYKPFLEKNNL
ncbi:hypothetical protein NOVO_05295 [Rickettsiales bacterium Ac37b]|nr:hypothetical protein NOVO_05295 [Rickettsiales bacterium Ac37b]